MDVFGLRLVLIVSVFQQLDLPIVRPVSEILVTLTLLLLPFSVFSHSFSELIGPATYLPLS